MKTIEEEMELWSTRSHDDFGKILNNIQKITKEYSDDLYEDMISIRAEYALDGNRKVIRNKVKKLLENWDIIPEDKKVNSLANKLFKF